MANLLLPAAGEEWEPIFNGKNLDGWVVKLAHHQVGDNFGDTFRVEHGLLRVSYDKYPEFGERFGHFFYRKKLSHFRLRVEYRFYGEQMKDGTNSTSKVYGNDEWVTVELEVLGSEHVRHRSGGQVVLKYERPMIGGGVSNGFDPAIRKDGTVLEDGYLGLQSESQPVEFRRVDLLNLSGCMNPKAKNYKSYYVHRDDVTCK